MAWHHELFQLLAVGAQTLGVVSRRSRVRKKTGTAGWYNTAAFHQAAAEENLYHYTINGDAFSDEIKAETIAKIKEDLGQVDLVVYSLASSKAQRPRDG